MAPLMSLSALTLSILLMPSRPVAAKHSFPVFFFFFQWIHVTTAVTIYMTVYRGCLSYAKIIGHYFPVFERHIG